MRAGFRRYLAVMHARNIEFLRDRTALGWNLLLPVLLVAGFAFLFSEQAGETYKVAIHGADFPADPSAAQRRQYVEKFPLFAMKYIKFVRITNLQTGLHKIRHHRLDMLVSLEGGQRRYWINAESKKGYILERLLWAAETGRSAAIPAQSRYVKQVEQGRKIRYIDWVLPGILGMNVMFSCLFGIGYVIVRYRKMGALKRFQATPLTAFEFVAAQVSSRLLIILLITVLVFAGCNLFLDFRVYGSYLSLFVVFALGALSMVSLGLIVAARTTSEEYANGVLNLLSWPMLIFSGVWFSLEGLHPLARSFAQWLPLTHMIDAARAIMNDGAGLVQVSWHLLVLVIMSLVFLLFAASIFKWDRF